MDSERDRATQVWEEEGLFKADAVNEEDSERYPGVEDEFRRATFLGETHPYPSWLRYCVSKVLSTEEKEEEEEEEAERGEANEILPCKLRSARHFSQRLI